MSQAKKSQDERNLKILRELISLPNNRNCFDCNQRGPTYVNVTIGSFVCTTCSGILRGLTPPHRVKSVTMTTFTPAEVQFVSTRGNKYCSNVWLATKSDTGLHGRSSDEHETRKRMIDIYERKLYYVEPKENPRGTQDNVLKNINIPNASVTVSEDAKLYNKISVSASSVAIPSNRTERKPKSISQSQSYIASFANFENANIFNSTVTTTTPALSTAPIPSQQASTSTNTTEYASTSNADRYAALKDLDEEFRSNNNVSANVFTSGPPTVVDAPVHDYSNPPALSVQSKIQNWNPFKDEVLAQDKVDNNWANFEPNNFIPDFNVCSSTNPFATNQISRNYNPFL